ncbi:hypothetical protein BH11BAC2_BH11BAC2_22090 [soil metagenome]
MQTQSISHRIWNTISLRIPSHLLNFSSILNFFSLIGTNLMDRSLTEIPSDHKSNKKLESNLPLPKIKVPVKIRILLAEDSVLNSGIIRSVLKENEFELDRVENGKKAIERLENNHYDLILMDLMMPVMDGFEATTYIRKEMNASKSKTPIIALVADITKVIAVKCAQTGMNDYITKPFNANELLTKITRHQQG